MALTDDNCATCAHSITLTSSSVSRVECRSPRNHEGVSVAWACRQLGIHETAEQLRERAVRDDLDYEQAMLRSTKAHSEREEIKRMLGVTK